MKRMILATVLTVAGCLPAAASVLTVEASKDVGQTVAALKSAIGEAGAKVLATVDHGAGAKSVGTDLGASQLVIFGNPQVGTPAMADNRLAGLRLPLKVLVYEDTDGQVWMAYDDPATLFEDLEGIKASSEYVAKMSAAFKNITDAAK